MNQIIKKDGYANVWLFASVVVVAVFMLPILTICSYLFAPASKNWGHLVDTVLSDYISNSLVLMVGVGVGAGTIGTVTAWFTSMYQFPGKKLLVWTLMLPLAIPAYIIAYTYTGLLDVAGPLQTWVRATFDVQYGQYWFPQVRSLSGAVLMLSLVLYPYVYLLTRAAFIDQSICVLEVSRTLGCSPWRSFYHLALPLARPATAAGLFLVLMETLADYGTVQYFGVNTLTTGIFRAWFGMFDEVAAAQLAAILLLFVFSLILLEYWSRRRSRFHHTTNRYREISEINLNGWRAWIVTLICFMPLLLGFIIPVAQLLQWSIETFSEMIDRQFILLAINSFTLAALAAGIALVVALLLGYGNRIHPSRIMRLCSRFAAMGYAIPGTVVAVGILIPLGLLDNVINDWLENRFGLTFSLMFSGSIFILLFAYTVRFLSVSLQTVEAGLGKIKPSMGEVARSLGESNRQVLRRIHLPIMKGSLFTALLIVFVDVLKELPATLILRPFDFNTLAIRAYELASDERLADSSTAALAIVLVGIVPVILLNSVIQGSRAGSRSS